MSLPPGEKSVRAGATSCVVSITSEFPHYEFTCDARSSSRRLSSNVSSSLSASCSSGRIASSTTRSPQFKLAVSTSSKLAAEKFSSAFANRDYALEPDCVPDKQRRRSRVQPELVDNFDFLTHAGERGWTCFLPAAMKPTIKQSAKPFKTILRLSA